MFTSVPDITEEFWKKVEKKHDTKVLAYALMQYIPTQTRKSKEYIWGIGYTTEKVFCFYHFPNQSWFGSFMKHSSAKELYLEIPFSSINSWSLPSKLLFWKRLVSNAKEHLTLVTDTDTYVFIPDVRKKGIIDTLTTYAKEKHKKEK